MIDPRYNLDSETSFFATTPVTYVSTPPLWKILAGMMALGLVIFSYGALANV